MAAVIFFFKLLNNLKLEGTTNKMSSGFCCVHLTGIPQTSDFSDEDLHGSLVQQFYCNDDAPAFDLRVVRHRETDISKGYAFLTFLQRDHAEAFIRSVQQPIPAKESAQILDAKLVPQTNTNNIALPPDLENDSELVESNAGLVESRLNVSSIDLSLLQADFSAPKPKKTAESSAGSSAKTQHQQRDLGMGRKSYPSKAKHAKSVTCSDKSKMKVDSKGYISYKKTQV